MSWQLQVWDPTGATSKATYTDTSPGGIAGEFRWSVRGDGTCLQMRFQAVPSSVNIGPRDIVQLTVDGQAVFWGFITRAWPSDDSRLREYVALGGYKLYEGRYVADFRSWSLQDAAAIASDIANTFKPPAVKYDSTRFPTSGFSTSIASAFGVPTSRILDDLAKAAGVRWGVDASGYVFFKSPSTSLSVAYSTSDIQWLPIEAEDIISSVALIGGIPTETQRIGGYDYTPEFIEGAATHAVYYYADSQDTTYKATRAFAYQEPLLEPSTAASSISSTNLTNPSNAFDGNDATYASATAGGTVALSANFPAAYGALLLLELTSNWAPSVQLDVTQYYDLTYSTVYTYSNLKPTQTGVYPLLVYVPVPTGIYATGIKVTVTDSIAADSVRIRRLQAIAPKDLSAYAQGLIRLPFQRPLEVRFNSIQTPVMTLTVTGAPNGDVSGNVDRLEYLLSPRRKQTTIKLARGSDEATLAIEALAQKHRREAELAALNLTRGK